MLESIQELEPLLDTYQEDVLSPEADSDDVVTDTSVNANPPPEEEPFFIEFHEYAQMEPILQKYVLCGVCPDVVIFLNSNVQTDPFPCKRLANNVICFKIQLSSELKWSHMVKMEYGQMQFMEWPYSVVASSGEGIVSFTRACNCVEDDVEPSCKYDRSMPEALTEKDYALQTLFHSTNETSDDQSLPYGVRVMGWSCSTHGGIRFGLWNVSGKDKYLLPSMHLRCHLHVVKSDDSVKDDEQSVFMFTPIKCR